MGRRERILDAALEVVGTAGIRALTHRAVDQVAHLPEGSTSNLYRSRVSLVHALGARLLELDLEHWATVRSTTLTGVEPRADSAVSFIADWVTQAAGAGRTRSAARYALFLAAIHDPILRASLQESRDALLDAVGALAPGTPTPRIADAIDQIDGLILHQLCLPRADFDPRPPVTAIVAGLSDRP